MSRAGGLSDIFEAIALESSVEELQKIIRREGEVDQVIYGGDGEPEVMTALVVAIRSGNENAARVLLANGADIEIGCTNKTAAVTAENLAREFNPDLANKLFSDEVLMGANERAKTARAAGVEGAGGGGGYSGGAGAGYVGSGGGGGYAVDEYAGGGGYSGGGGGGGGDYLAAAGVGYVGGGGGFGAASEDKGVKSGYEKCSGYGEQEEALFNACLSEGVDEVRELLRSGVNIHATDAEGMTALFQATRNQTADAVEIIEALGVAEVDFNAKDSIGRTALMYAVCGEEYEEFLSPPDVIEVLIANNADINEPDSNGWTAIMRAVQLDNESAFTALLENGADLEVKSADNFTLQDLVITSPNPSFKTAIEGRHSGGAGGGYAGGGGGGGYSEGASGGGGGGGGGISRASAGPLSGAGMKRRRGE